ncbi:SPOR domain-containing protein [Octadecabacter sp.]|nr:SPOR domain-containing protein [Octadecabacter sp.]
MQCFGKRSGFLSTVAIVAAVLGTSAAGQTLRNANPPAEAPPSNFSGNQYVDSNGCAFVRAGIGGTESWVPRVSRSREQLCGFQPTLASALPPLAPLPSRPTSEPTQAVAAAQPTPAPAPVAVAAASAQSARPAVSQPTQAAAPTPPLTARVTPAAAPSPSPQVIVPEAAPQPRVLTRSQACAGLTGIQPNLVSQRTGRPIDCGGAAPVVQQVARVAPPVVAAPQPEAAQTTQNRLSRAQACAAMAASGRQYISTTTGRPLQCATQGQPTQLAGLARIQADLRLPQQAYSNPLDSAPGSVAIPQRDLPRVSRSQVPYSNPLDSAPGSTFTPNMNTQVVQVPVVVTHARSQTVWQALIGQEPAPYSNPTRTYALAAPTVPDGLEHVWTDGRLNTQRGLPVASTTTTVRYAAQPVQQRQTAVTTRVATQQRPQAEQISGHRYVQVGTYGTRDQAQSIAQSLRSRGLPMRVGVYNQQGRDMRIVLAGPFANDSQLQSALNTARGAGFSGAFTRR